MDMCDVVSGFIDSVLNITGSGIASNIICKLTIEAEVRVIGKLTKQNKDTF